MVTQFPTEPAQRLSRVMFSRAKDDWSTPQDFFDRLDAEFQFTCDVAATADTAKCADYYGPDHPDLFRRDALAAPWDGVCFMNPPYSRVRDFIDKAAVEARHGVVVVALVPARTCTRWWHAAVWDHHRHCPRPHVALRFVKGRLRFGGASASAPFPSVVIVFGAATQAREQGRLMVEGERSANGAVSLCLV